MSYCILKLCWSQTDDEVVIVQADSLEQAKTKQKSNARYVHFLGQTEKII